MLNRIIPIIILLIVSTSYSNEYEGYLIDIFEDEYEDFAELHYNYYFLMKEPSDLLTFVKDSNDIKTNLLKNGAFEINLASDIQSMSCCLIGYTHTNGKGTKAEFEFSEMVYRINNMINDKFDNTSPNFNVDNMFFKIYKVKIDFCICSRYKGEILIPNFALKKLFYIEEIEDDSIEIFEDYFNSVLGLK